MSDALVSPRPCDGIAQPALWSVQEPIALELAVKRVDLGDEAWHADKIGRVKHHPIVGLLSLGAARPFLLRPLGGGRSRRFVLGSGDLLVMGGACQHRFEHAVPKLSRPTAPRLSLTFRHDD